MAELRRPAKLYIAALVLVALGLASALRSWPVPTGDDRAAVVVVLLGLMTAAWLFPLPLAFQTKLYLDTSVLVAAVLLCAPTAAMLVAGAGAALAHAARREDPSQTLFNAAQSMLQAATGALVVGLGAGGVVAARPAGMLLAVAAGVAMLTVNDLLVAGMVALGTGTPPWGGWSWGGVRGAVVERLATLAQAGIGVAAAILGGVGAGLPMLLVLPAGAVHAALSRHVRSQERLRQALRDRDAMLAQAEQAAHVGSWEWDVATGEELWSEQVHRLLGVDPAAVPPSRAAFLARVHPEDRAAVTRAVGEAVAAGRALGLDHRVVGGDGAARIVHQRIAALPDDAGRSRRVIGTLQDVTARKTMEAELAHRAGHDPLTGLANRARFGEALEATLARTGGRAGALAVLFLDVNNFKVVNDSLGHEAGDRLLVAVGERLRACLRPGDTVARLGGDEFTVLLPSLSDAGEPARICERIGARLGAPLVLEGRELHPTASIGIAPNPPGAARAVDLLRDADVAMYAAKRRRAGYALFEPWMAEQARGRLTLEAELHRAVAAGELRLHYQPIVDLATNRVAEVEALVRWQHPRHGLLRPDEFLPLAVETGLIVPIGRWVLAEACRRGRVWQRARPDRTPVPVCVNLSGREFLDPGLVANVVATLHETGLGPSALKLEVSEQVATGDAAETVAKLAALREVGVRLALDDFGTGYSGLSALKRYPIDGVKIDRSFVAGLGRDPVDAAIVRAVLALSRALGLGTTAEGIETEEQHAALGALGCERGQGNFFAEPLLGEAVDTLLAGTGAVTGPVGERRPTPVTAPAWRVSLPDSRSARPAGWDRDEPPTAGRSPRPAVT